MSRIRGIEAKILKLQKETLHYSESKKTRANEGYRNGEAVLDKVDAERQQIVELLYKLPELNHIFDVHRKIGEGTFSSVYLGSLKQHAGLSDSEKRWFALKHLVPTAHPARIEHELRCLQDMGGKHNVIGVELCLRHFDTIVFVMPYIPHRKFSEYVGDMDAEEVRQYMRALMVALRHVHSFGVIHRDVKPSNFLYDRENKRYLLVDFGLAQRLCEEPGPPPAHTQNNKRLREEDDSVQSAKRMALDLSIGAKCSNNIIPSPKRVTVPKVQIAKQNIPKNPPSAHVAGGVRASRACACASLGGVCTWCGSRATARAPRAGTQGFRPPEVLLKSPRQSTTVDTWAAGVVLASLLSARYPFFRAADDVSALAELADLIGTEPLQRTAESLGRRLVSSTRRRGLCLRALAARLRGRAPPPAPPSAPPCAFCRLPLPHCLCRDRTAPAHEFDPNMSVAGFPDAAFSLAARLLEPDPRARYSAQQALDHPFLAQAP